MNATNNRLLKGSIHSLCHKSWQHQSLIIVPILQMRKTKVQIPNKWQCWCWYSTSSLEGWWWWWLSFLSTCSTSRAVQNAYRCYLTFRSLWHIRIPTWERLRKIAVAEVINHKIAEVLSPTPTGRTKWAKSSQSHLPTGPAGCYSSLS